MSSDLIVPPREMIALPAKPSDNWLLQRNWDLLFIVNIFWPLIALSQVSFSTSGTASSLWFSVTLAHRWLTLPILASELPRKRDHWKTFVLSTGVACVLFATVWLTCKDLIALTALVFIVDCHHRSSQHSGVLRIYERINNDENTFRAILFRVFCTYVFMRSFPFIFLQDRFLSFLAHPVFSVLDFTILVVPLYLLSVLKLSKSASVYLLSALALYVSLLVSIILKQIYWTHALFTAGLVFHAVEYLGMVEWRIRSQTAHGTPASNRVIPFVLFVTAVMVIQYSIAAHLQWYWIFINVLMSLLHFSWDAFLWRRGYHKKP